MQLFILFTLFTIDFFSFFIEKHFFIRNKRLIFVTMFKGLKHSGKEFPAEPVEMSTSVESVKQEARPIASGVGG